MKQLGYKIPEKVVIDPIASHPDWQLYLDIVRKSFMLSSINQHGFEYAYNIASEKDKQFLETMRDIAHDPNLIREQSIFLNLQRPEVKYLLSLKL